MRAFVSFPMLMIALAPVAAIGQAAAPETAAPVVVADAAESAPVPVRAAAHGGPGDDGARHTRARRAGEGDLHRRHAAGAARRLGSLVEAFDMDGDGRSPRRRWMRRAPRAWPSSTPMATAS